VAVGGGGGTGGGGGGGGGVGSAPTDAEVIVRASIGPQQEKVISFEGNSKLSQNVIKHLCATGKYTSNGSSLVNTKGEPLLDLYRYLQRQMHKCSIGRVKWGERAVGGFRKIEEIYLWS